MVMPLYVIKGEYRIVGSSPDGDSVRFYPDNPDVWTQTGIKAKPNAQGGVQLRLDAIDALETHYTPPHGRRQHQPIELGEGAGKALLDSLGFADVARDENDIVTSATPAKRPGYILTKFADVYGRAVSLIYAGTRPGKAADGSTQQVGVAELRKSVNYQLLAEGWVYPTFYSKLFVDFREALAEAAVTAREKKLGVWAEDATLTGATIRSEKALQDNIVILPKLFRRLAEYLTDADSVDLGGFKKFIETHGDRIFTVPRGQATGLDTLLATTKTKVTLTLPPEQIVFQEA